MVVLLTILAASALLVKTRLLVLIAHIKLVLMDAPLIALAARLAKPVTLLLLPKTRHQAHHPVLTPAPAKVILIPVHQAVLS